MSYVFSIWAVGSIPPAGTIDLKRLNPILGLSAYPPRIRASFLNRKLRRKIDAELLRFDSANRA
jgi:hypothetical protein